MKNLIFAVLLTLVFSPSYADGGNSWGSTIKTLPKDIVSLVEAEKFEDAIPKLQKFIKSEKENADAWNYLGYSLRKTGDYKASLKAYKKALKVDGEHLGALEYLGELYLTLEKPGKAKKLLDKIGKICGECDQFNELSAAISNYETSS